MDPFLIHGLLMAAAWLALLPAGVLIARFFKVTRSQDWPNALDNQFWWHCHRILNYAGVLLATVGFLWIVSVYKGLSLGSWHGRLGLLTLVLAWLQVASGLLRGSKGGPTDTGADPDDPRSWRGDHYDMTRRRRLFEAWHKSAGYLALALAVPSAWLGLRLIGSAYWIQLLPWLAALIFLVLFRRFTRQGRWIDTHEAIWGPRRPPSSQTQTQTNEQAKGRESDAA